MPRPSRFQSRSLQHVIDRFVGDDPERVAAYEKALSNARAAQAIYDLRTEAALTQAELAARVGTTPSVISRLEDADYEGHTLSMLSRIAAALGRRVEMRFPLVEAKAPSSAVKAGSKGAPEKSKGYVLADPSSSSKTRAAALAKPGPSKRRKGKA